MKIGIIGGGASGVFAAIRIKELHPDYDVTIFERNNKLIKKIYATGNGRCNFANSDSIEDAYNTSDIYPILNEFNYNEIIKYFDSIGIKSRNLDNLYYPYSLSAATVAEKLLKRLEELKVKVILECKITEYGLQSGSLDKKVIHAGNNIYLFDALVFACGGMSAPQFGSDGIIYSTLRKHKYEIKNLTPSLCPIKIKENVNKIDGVRVKAKATLLSGDKEVYSEDGEVQFRSDALSGIVIFNMAFKINKLNLQPITTKIKIDFVPETKEKINKEEYYSYLNDKLALYLINNNIDIHNAVFTYKSLYSFDVSQVSSGGVSLVNLTSNMESKLEKNIFFIGELVDVDAKCGGYNLMWAFASAEKVAKSL